MRRRKLTGSLAVAACIAGVAAFSAPAAQAKITTPASGATVSGDVTIVEDTGGKDTSLFGGCGLFGSSPDSTITVTAAGGGAVLSASKGSSGGWSTIWHSQLNLDGDYVIKSTAKNINGVYPFCSTSTSTLSSFTVHLVNTITFTDDGGAGVIKIQPFRQELRVVTTDGYDSGVRHDPNMRFEGIPNAPSSQAPGVACDPNDPNLVARIVANGPQSCFTGLPPLPVIHVPPPVPAPPCDPTTDPSACVPGSPNPPPPPCDPTTNPAGCAPSQCAATGCSDTVIVVTFSDDSLALQGAFHAADHAFAASVELLAGGQPTGTTYQMRHQP